jgi:hypothetical protein
MRHQLHRSGENPNTRVSSYESLLDLFTLLSFILIVASFIFVAQAKRGERDSAAITASLATKGAGAPASPARDVALLIFSQEGSKSKLVLFDGNTGTASPFFVTTNDLDQRLEQISPMLRRAAKVQFDIPRAREPRDDVIILRAQEWLAVRQMTNWDIAFY